MNEENIFKVNYDDQPDAAISRISSILKKYGLKIEELVPNEEQTFIEFEVIKI